MEMFSKMLRKMEGASIIKGFNENGVGNNELCISHLLFANDTILFCDASVEQILHIKMLLICFTVGLKVNLSNSEMVPLGEFNVEVLAKILGCKIGSLPMSYLGMPLGASYKSATIWTLILEKLERRLVGWKKLYLPKGDHLTMLKSTLSNILFFSIHYPY